MNFSLWYLNENNQIAFSQESIDSSPTKMIIHIGFQTNHSIELLHQ